MENGDLGPNYTAAHIMHDAELLAGGAEIINGQLHVTEEQKKQLKAEGTSNFIVRRVADTVHREAEMSQADLQEQSEARDTLLEDVHHLIVPYTDIFDYKLPNAGLHTGTDKSQRFNRKTSWNAEQTVNGLHVDSEITIFHKLKSGLPELQHARIISAIKGNENVKNQALPYVVFDFEDRHVKSIHLTMYKLEQLNRVGSELAAFYQSTYLDDNAAYPVTIAFNVAGKSPSLTASQRIRGTNYISEYVYDEAAMSFKKQGQDKAKSMLNAHQTLTAEQYKVLLSQVLAQVPTIEAT